MLRRVLVVVGTLALGVAGPPVAWSQEADLNSLVLDWLRGRYASPLLCEIDGESVRGLRRLLIAPGPRHVRPPVDKLMFVDMDVDGASRCFTELAASAPNIVGHVFLRHPTRGRVDTAQRDFDAEMRRKNGFDLEISEGKLRIAPIGEDVGEPQVVDFRSGHASLRMVSPGTDAQRVLLDFQSPRKMELKLEARDGTTLRLPIFLVDLR
jgi:hypothetical protein